MEGSASATEEFDWDLRPPVLPIATATGDRLKQIQTLPAWNAYHVFLASIHLYNAGQVSHGPTSAPHEEVGCLADSVPTHAANRILGGYITYHRRLHH